MGRLAAPKAVLKGSGLSAAGHLSQPGSGDNAVPVSHAAPHRWKPLSQSQGGALGLTLANGDAAAPSEVY